MKFTKFFTVVSVLIFTQSPVLYAGGSSTGGGSKNPLWPADAVTVSKQIENMSPYLKMFFNYFDYFVINLSSDKKFKSSSDDVYKAISKKIFGTKGRNIKTLIDQYKPNILLDGACKDINNQDVDASVVNTPPNTICFSVKRIAVNLPMETVFKTVVALAAHEYSHLMGTTEEEANILQMSAFSNIENRIVGSWDAKYFYSPLKNDVENLERNLNIVTSKLNSDSALEEFCVFATALSSNADAAMKQNLGHSGLLLLNAKASVNLEIIYHKLSWLPLVCVRDLSKEMSDAVDKMFNGRDEVSLREHMKSTRFPEDAKIRRIGYKDTEKAKVELDDVVSIWKEIKKSLPVEVRN